MTEKKFIITEEQIKEIDVYIKNHSSLSVRALLKQLPILEEKK